jgi:hypothetical protein
MTAAPSAEEQTDTIPTLIGEAFEAARNYPPHARLVEIDKLLRKEIDRLSTIAGRMADKRPHRSRGWYALANAVDKADDALSFQLGEVPLAAALHVAELARRIVELRRETGVTP